MRASAGGSQGDIYQIKKTVEELNAIYQVGRLAAGPARVPRAGSGVDETSRCGGTGASGCVPLTDGGVRCPLTCVRALWTRAPIPPRAILTQQLICRFYMKDTGMDQDTVERNTSRDFFMTPEVALQVRLRAAKGHVGGAPRSQGVGRRGHVCSHPQFTHSAGGLEGVARQALVFLPP